jgi:hypothetical protein
VFTPFHKPPYPYLYGRSVDETTTVFLRKQQLLSYMHKEDENNTKKNIFSI